MHIVLKRILIGIGILIVVVASAAGIFFGLYIFPFMKTMKATKVIQYDDKLTFITGGGGNSGILVSDSLVMVIDTKMDEAAVQLAEQVMNIAGNKPILVVNTHIHKDHITGNKHFKGHTILAGGNYGKGTWIEENGVETLPTSWVKDSITISMGDEKVTIMNLGYNAHTQSDLLIYLNRRKVLFGGDVILNKQSPAMFSKYKSDPEGYLKAINDLKEHYEIKTVVPGHGEIGGLEILDTFGTYFKDMKVASLDPSREDGILKKYKGWNQIPFLMAPSATIGYMKKQEHR